MLRPLNPKNASVLLVEDSPDDLRMLELALERFGIRKVREAMTAEEAVRSLSQQPSDVILLDYRLPGMDGLAFLELLRSRWPDCYVLFVTGARDERVAAQAIKLGASDYVSKDELLTSGVVRALQAALRHRIEQAERERGDLMSGSAGALAAALEEADWLIETLGGGERPAESRLTDVNIATGFAEYMEAAFSSFPDAAVEREQTLARQILHEGLSPLQVVSAYRFALGALRTEEVTPPFHPALCLARVLARLTEAYQVEQSVRALDRGAA